MVPKLNYRASNFFPLIYHGYCSVTKISNLFSLSEHYKVVTIMSYEQYQIVTILGYLSLSLLALCTASLLTISGRIFTVAFDDTPEDPPLDVITRVTVGNRLCNHLDENGEL